MPKLPKLPDDVPAYRLWWALILHRLADLQLAIPDDMKGILQFVVIDGEPGAPTIDAFHLILDGKKTRPQEGMAKEYKTWVFIDANNVGRSLEGDRSIQAFWVGGERKLHRDFSDFLENAEQRQSPLGLRMSAGNSKKKG